MASSKPKRQSLASVASRALKCMKIVPKDKSDPLPHPLDLMFSELNLFDSPDVQNVLKSSELTKEIFKRCNQIYEVPESDIKETPINVLSKMKQLERRINSLEEQNKWYFDFVSYKLQLVKPTPMVLKEIRGFYILATVNEEQFEFLEGGAGPGMIMLRKAQSEFGRTTLGSAFTCVKQDNPWFPTTIGIIKLLDIKFMKSRKDGSSFNLENCLKAVVEDIPKLFERIDYPEQQDLEMGAMKFSPRKKVPMASLLKSPSK